MDLYIVRHAESMGNATGDYSTDLHDSLSEKGQQQAVALASRLDALPIEQVICSPLLRTMQTIAPFLQANSRQAELLPELAEACWHEKTTDIVADYYNCESFQMNDELDDLFSGPRKRPIEHESYSEGLARIHACHEFVMQCVQSNCQSMLLVSHGFTSGLLMNLLRESPLVSNIHLNNTGLCHLRYANNHWNVQFINRV